MSQLQKKTAIARELSIPTELDLSQSLAVAAEMVEPSATLLQVADQLIDLIGCKVNGAVPEAVVTPAADGAATAASSGASSTTTASSRSSAAGKRTASGFLDASGCLDTNSKATKQKKILLT